MIADIIRAASIPLAMALIGGLAWHAMSLGIDGALFMTAVCAIGGLGGYEVKAVIQKKKSTSSLPNGATKKGVPE